MTIVFWDIHSTVGAAWSPNTWKVRYCLNLKKIAYKTKWVEIQDIAANCQKLGIPAATLGRNGKTAYALPAIYDPSTGVYISDSVRIAEYLDTQYPDGPRIFPNNTIGLQVDFEDCLNAKLAPLWSFVVTPIIHILSPASQEYYRTTRERAWGKKLEEIPPTGDKSIQEPKWKAITSWNGGVSMELLDALEGYASVN